MIKFKLFEKIKKLEIKFLYFKGHKGFLWGWHCSNNSWNRRTVGFGSFAIDYNEYPIYYGK